MIYYDWLFFYCIVGFPPVRKPKKIQRFVGYAVCDVGWIPCRTRSEYNKLAPRPARRLDGISHSTRWSGWPDGISHQLCLIAYWRSSIRWPANCLSELYTSLVGCVVMVSERHNISVKLILLPYFAYTENEYKFTCNILIFWCNDLITKTTNSKALSFKLNNLSN